MCAPVAVRIVLMLLPPLPITLLIALGGTETFLDLVDEFVNLPESSVWPLKLKKKKLFNHVAVITVIIVFKFKRT